MRWKKLKKTDGKNEQRMLKGRRTRTNRAQESDRDRAQSCWASPKNGPPKAPLPSITPIHKVFAACLRNNMVTICPGATKQLNTLNRMAHPDVQLGNTAPSGLKAELPPILMGMRSPSVPPQPWIMERKQPWRAGGIERVPLSPRPGRKWNKMGVSYAVPDLPLRLKWHSPWLVPATPNGSDTHNCARVRQTTLLCEPDFTFVLLPSCSLEVSGKVGAEGSPCVHVCSGVSYDSEDSSCHGNCHLRKWLDKIMTSRNRTSSGCSGRVIIDFMFKFKWESHWVWLV